MSNTTLAKRSVTFAVATYGAGEVLNNNFLASPCLRVAHPRQILVQRDFVSASRAYNDAIDKAENDLIIFAHQDVIFPESWLSQLDRALKYLEANDPQWGVLGCYGKTRLGEGVGHIYSPGRGEIGKPFELPLAVQTLDEIVLVVKKSSGLRFDENLPHFHLYGTDIRLSAAKQGMTSYVIPAVCIHNAHQYLVLPSEFYECCRHIKRVWEDALPIETTCVSITKFNLAIYGRRLQEFRLRYLRRKTFIAPRMKDVPLLLRQASSEVPGL